jgi:predicted PhzF superfamily epimerase YddE/YHI9
MVIVELCGKPSVAMAKAGLNWLDLYDDEYSIESEVQTLTVAAKVRASEFEEAALELGRAIAETCWTCRQITRSEIVLEQDYSGRSVESIGPLYEKARRLHSRHVADTPIWFPLEKEEP